MNRFCYLLILILPGLPGLSQPVITSVTPIATYPGNKVLITGSGFSNTPAQLKVWFDHVQGTVTSSSDLAIEVTLPAQARLSNLEVLNLTSRLSVKSPLKMVPTFGGDDFDPTQVGTPQSFAAPNEVFDVCSCDLDGDGKPDMAGSKLGGPDLMILRNTSTPGTMAFASSNITVNAQTLNLACGDLNGDGKPDLVVSRRDITNQVFVLRNTSTVGAITFAPVTVLLMDVGHNGFRIGIRDLNMDGKPEVIVSNSGANIVYAFVNQSSGGTLGFAAPEKIPVLGATTTYGLDVQDLDGDNKPEIIVNQFGGSDIFILRNLSTSLVNFAAAQKITRAGTLNHLTTADFNEDGKLDLAVTDDTFNSVSVFLNQSTVGTLTFGAPIAMATGNGPWGIDASDVDGDGDIDILVGNRFSGAVDMTVMKNNGNNASLAFVPVSVAVGKKSKNLRVGDYDGDGKPDFAFTTDTGNSLEVMRNMNCFIPTILNTAPLTICAGQTIRLNSTPAPGITSFDWKKGGVPVSSTPNSFLDLVGLLDAGSYTVTAISEVTCMQESAPIVVSSGLGTLPADPTISSNSPRCSVPGQNLQLDGPTVPGVVYHWTGPNGFSSALEDPQILNVTAVHAGDYSLQLSNGTCFTNSSTTRVDIAGFAGFTVNSSVPSNTICQATNLTLSVNLQTGHTYQWTKDGADLSGQTTPSLLVTQEGAYAVRITNTGIAGCSLTTSPTTSVIVLTAPSAAFDVPVTSCINDVLTFTDQSTLDSRATAIYAWDFKDTGTATVSSPTHAYTVAATYDATLSLSYSGVTGCSSILSKSILVSDFPVVTATTDKASMALGELAQLEATGATTYAWTPIEGLSDPAISNPIASPAVTTIYMVDGTTNGCVGSASITVEIVVPPPTTIGIPNVFTPNGDAINDLWVFQATEADCTVSLFDAQGRRVFEQKGIAISWDGNYSGAAAPEGTYYYTLGCPTGGTITGHVLLAR